MARKISVEIVGDASSVSKAFKQAESSASGFGSKFGGAMKTVGKVALGAGAAITGGFAVAMKVGFDELAEAQKVTAQTEAVLKSTGGAAKVTAKEVMGLAEALSAKSGVDDEAIQSGQNMLLTFTRIRNEAGAGNDIFNQATKATLDLSVAMGKDLPSSALLVGKALNDPIKGMTSLSRAGIQFTAEQQKMIKGFVESGNAMGAQKIILGELTTQFGGSAEAFGSTMPGAIAKMKNAFDEAAGGLAQTFAPALTSAAQAAAGFFQKFNEAEGLSAKLQVVWQAIKSGAETAWKAISDAVSRIDWAGVVSTLRTKIAEVISKVASALSDAASKIDWAALGKTIGTMIVDGLRTLTQLVKSVDWGQVGSAIVKGIVAFLRGVDWGAVLGATFKALVAVVKAVGSLLLAAGLELGKAILDGARDGAVAAWPGIKAFLASIPGRITGLFANAGTWLYNAGVAVVQGLWNGMRAKWDEFVGWLQSLPGKIPGVFKKILGISSPSLVMEEVGKDTLLGLQTGMQAKWATVAPYIAGLGGKVVENFILGVSSAAPQFTGKLAEVASAAVENARAAVEAKQQAFADAFGRLGDMAKRAFDAKTAQLLDEIDRKFQAKIANWQRFGDALTPAEQALQALDNLEKQRNIDQQAADAQAAMAKAQLMEEGVEKAAAVAAAEEQIRQAALAQSRQSLELAAAIEREARNKQVAEQIAKLEEAKALEMRNLEERRAQKFEKLEQELADLVASLSKHPKEHDKAQKKIVALLRSFGVEYKAAGKNLGEAFADGMRDAQSEVGKAARELAAEAARYLKLKSPAEKGPLASLNTWWAAFADTLLAGLDTGKIGRAAAAAVMAPPSLRVASTSPAAFTASSTLGAPTAPTSGPGGVVIQFHGPVYGGREGIREITRQIREQLQQTDARNR